MGALLVLVLGVAPGLFGEERSLLNRYIPPVVPTPESLSLKAVAMGVGSVGRAGTVSLLANWELMGVFGDRSEASSNAPAERLRPFIFFKLEEEKFFRSPDLD